MNLHLPPAIVTVPLRYQRDPKSQSVHVTLHYCLYLAVGLGLALGWYGLVDMTTDVLKHWFAVRQVLTSH